MARVTADPLILIFLVGIVPSLISLLILRKIQQRWRERLRRARFMTAYRQRTQIPPNFPNDEFDFDKPFIGDISCRFNARSPYLRCAVNPSGPCEDCSYYEAKD